MEASLKNVDIIVGECRKMPDIAILMGIHYDCCKTSLMSLKTNNPPSEMIKGSEGAAVGYALFEVIRDKLVGSPLELIRSRVSRISCDSLNGKFLISWNTQGSFTTLRKTIGLVLSTFDPMKLYSKYAENMKLLGGKNDRDVFNSKANEMISAIKKNVKFVVCGKIKVDAAKLKELLAQVEKKMPDMDTPAAKEMEKPPAHPDHKCEYPHIKVSGIALVAIADYIRSKSGGMGIEIIDDGITVYNHSWKTKQSALSKSDRIKDYVRQKYEKLGDDFPCVFAYMAITQGYADCHTVTQIIKKMPKASGMVELIKKHI